MSRGLVLVALPRLLAEIVERAVSAEPDLDVLGSFPDGTTAAASLGQRRVDAVVMSGSWNSLDASQILATWPNAKVLAIATGATSSTLVELVPRVRELGDVGAPALLAAFRDRRLDRQL
jgi:hypothetical protein